MINRLRALGIIALAPYLVLSQSAFPIAAGSSDITSKSRMLIAEAKVAMDTSPAISGVKLLHEIFQRLRNSNQLALNNPTKQLTAASQAVRGSLDPLLAIRPSEKSLNKSSPSLAYASQNRHINPYSNQEIASSDTGSNSQIREYSPHKKMAMPWGRAAGGAGGAGGASEGTNFATSSNISPSDKFIREVNLDARQAKSSSAPASSAGQFEPGQNMKSRAHKSSFAASSSASYTAQNTPQNTAAYGASNSAANVAVNAKMSQQNNQMLVHSISNLMQSTKQLSELSQATDSAGRTYTPRKRDSFSDKTLATLPGGPVIQEYNSGATAKVSGAKDLSMSDAARNADGDSSENSPLMVPDQPAQYRIMRNQLMALLPPSVVSGIPLARLGATEQELTSALSNRNAQKQKIEDWTIWTLKGANDHSAGVQLYLRHSVVEAIRVFQPFYLGDEVGIRIGDDLRTVKNKFGEPAIILPEPVFGGKHNASQNYVYPISHVAFQLARSKTDPSPQVVSVLIFDVQ